MDHTAPRTYALFYAFLSKLKGYNKEDAVWDFTDGRTTHLSELSEMEYFNLCNHLNGLVISAYDDKRRRFGSAVLNLLTKMGFRTTCRTGWMEIDRFLSDKRIAGKNYRKLSADELETLIPKLRAMKDKGYIHNYIKEGGTTCLEINNETRT